MPVTLMFDWSVYFVDFFLLSKVTSSKQNIKMSKCYLLEQKYCSIITS